MRYENLRGHIVSHHSAKKELRFDLALIQSGGMIALISNTVMPDTSETYAKKKAAEDRCEIGRIIGQMAKAKVNNGLRSTYE